MAVSIPRSPSDLTPPWLGSVLDTEVRTVVTEPIGTGQTGATYRLTVTYAFYTQVADVVQVPIPKSYYCDISEDGGDFVLLLADMAPAVQGDQIGGCDAVEAELAARAIAGLHAPTWCDPKFANFPGLAMSMPNADAAKGLGDVAVMATQLTLDRLGADMTAQDHQTATQSMALVTPWLLAEPGRFSLMHGDYRLDNLLFDPDRTRVTVVDWQTLGAGLPGRDLAYFTATSLLPDVRANLDEQLVAAYHDELLATASPTTTVTPVGATINSGWCRRR
jgi:aminoglycoside/choline kinase family phosphotransferase